MAFKKILIAVDESAFAAHAADIGTELARSLGAEVAFVTVIDTSIGGPAQDSIPADLWMATAEREAKDRLAAYRDRAAAHPPALTFTVSGKPATKIVQAAANWPADVIVMGTHGRGVVANMLLGSVAQGVLRSADCPVLIVRAQK